jgi:hypothetical protein
MKIVLLVLSLICLTLIGLCFMIAVPLFVAANLINRPYPNPLALNLGGAMMFSLSVGLGILIFQKVLPRVWKHFRH